MSGVGKRGPGAALLGLVAVGGFLVGGIVVWLVTGSASAEWVGAIGQWVGGIGTIAAVFWAVHVFRDERGRIRQADRDERRNAEALARSFSFSGRVQSKSGRRVQSFLLTAKNESSRTVIVTDVSVEGLGRKSDTLPQNFEPGTTDIIRWHNMPYETGNDDEIKNAGKLHPATVTYTIDGVGWIRTGTGDPVRIE